MGRSILSATPLWARAMDSVRFPGWEKIWKKHFSVIIFFLFLGRFFMMESSGTGLFLIQILSGATLRKPYIRSRKRSGKRLLSRNLLFMLNHFLSAKEEHSCSPQILRDGAWLKGFQTFRKNSAQIPAPSGDLNFHSARLT